jgi:AraC-like DNA-binding protein/mannose-6-phosphate isomerase-like protein (cupin superfamily)
VQNNISFTPKKEYTLQIENVTLRMLTYPIYEKPVDEHRDAMVSKFPLHTHAHAELFTCSEGSFSLQIKSGLLPVSAGDVVIVPPKFPHRMLPTAPGTVYHCLDFICVGRRRTGCTDLQKPLLPLCNGDFLLIARSESELCHQIAKVAGDKEEISSPLAALRLATALLELSELPLQKIGRADAPASLPTAAPEDITDINRLVRLDYLLNGCFTNPELSVALASKLLFISERQLERIAKKEYGKPFRRALCDRRLEAAEQMLLETDWSVTRIAETVGFTTKAAFCRAFKGKHGISAAEYKMAKNSTR